jgi:hypothetical protein
VRHEHESPEIKEPFWQLDEELGELELAEGSSGLERYTVRLKARTGSSPYRARSESYPRQHDGTQHEVSGKAYVLVPEITLTAAFSPKPPPSDVIGHVTRLTWQEMRHRQIASLHRLYYEADGALTIWEVTTWRRLDEFTQGGLWLSFETWLARRFPQATRILTDDAEPFDETQDNRDFLSALGYTLIKGTEQFFSKEVAR